MYTGGGDAIISQNERTLSTHLRETKALKLHQQTYRQKTQQHQHQQQQQQQTREREREREGRIVRTWASTLRHARALWRKERDEPMTAHCAYSRSWGKKNPPPPPPRPPTPFKSTQKKKFLKFGGMESHGKEDFIFIFLLFFCEFQHNILFYTLKPKKSPKKIYLILRMLDSFIITLY
jgi:hypothetical protein